VTLSWPQSTDNVAVTQYRVSRNGVGVGTVPQPSSGAVSFTDTGLAPVTSYSYVVTAMDAAANAATSATVVVTTLNLAAPGTFTFNSVADAKVDASAPTANYGTAALRVDASPDVRSYLRFDAAAITGTVQSATLRVWATSSQSSGYTVRSVADNGWIESGTGAITSATQPSGSISATVLGSSGPVVAGSWVTVDVVAMIAGPGTYSVVLQTTSTTALALASREDPLHPPQLVVTAT
jgi:hypothetical protein